MPERDPDATAKPHGHHGVLRVVGMNHGSLLRRAACLDLVAVEDQFDDPLFARSDLWRELEGGAGALRADVRDLQREVAIVVSVTAVPKGQGLEKD